MDRRLMNTSYLQAKLKQLHSIHGRTVSEYGDLVASLQDECTILCEAIPNYKIRSKIPGEGEAGEGGVRLKKETHNVEKLEHEILTQYEHFLQLLQRLQKKQHPEQQALGSRLCARLVRSAAAEFNHNDTLLKLAVRFANAKSSRAAAPCLTALQEFLDGEMVSDATEYVTEAILAIVKTQHHALNPKILGLLLHIRIAMLDMHRQDITEERAKNKQMKKKDKELARQMQKAQARRDRAELATKQSTLVQRILAVYLRVLQASHGCTPAHQTKILAPTLEGLAKFAPLVNVEIHQLLMQALKDILAQETASVTTRLHTLVAVACLARKDAVLDGADWRVDLAYFHDVLYRCLPETLSCPEPQKPTELTAEEEAEAETRSQASGAGGVDNSDARSVGSAGSVGTLSSQAFSIANSMAQQKFLQSNASLEWTYRVNVMLRAVDLLLLTQRNIPANRIAAFVRRFLHYSTHCHPHISMALLALCHRLTLKHPSCSSILLGGADHQVGGRGVYNPGSEDIEHTFADTSFGWELSALRAHFHPTLREVTNTIVRHYHKTAKRPTGSAPAVSRQLDALGPYEVLEKYDTSMGDVRPPPPTPESRLKNKQRQQQLKQQQQKGEAPSNGKQNGKHAGVKRPRAGAFVDEDENAGSDDDY